MPAEVSARFVRCLQGPGVQKSRRLAARFVDAVWDICQRVCGAPGLEEDDLQCAEAQLKLQAATAQSVFSCSSVCTHCMREMTETSSPAMLQAAMSLCLSSCDAHTDLLQLDCRL
jgi:hypothetical protein